MEDDKEPIWGTHCMSCDFNKLYYEGDKVPESCPQCGEHKNYDMLHLPSLHD